MYLSSSSEARTFVNGRLLNGRVELKSGSRIIFGAAHVFRFVHPSRIEAQLGGTDMNNAVAPAARRGHGQSGDVGLFTHSQWPTPSKRSAITTQYSSVEALRSSC